MEVGFVFAVPVYSPMHPIPTHPYSKEPDKRDWVLTGGLRPPDPTNKSASGLSGNVTPRSPNLHFHRVRRPTFAEGLGTEPGSENKLNTFCSKFAFARSVRFRKEFDISVFSVFDGDFEGRSPHNSRVRGSGGEGDRWGL